MPRLRTAILAAACGLVGAVIGVAVALAILAPACAQAGLQVILATGLRG